ncbi:MAG TPA: recombinase family protein [Solirubrobacteraceae bacterium]|nr:recombinase family protein [Solirubrobacteraceae bacterium]
MASPRLRLDALIRVSQRDDREGESFRSPGQQLDICKRCADSNDAVIAAVHEAIDVSGKTMDRADIDTAVARIRAGETDGVVVAWLDRFSRAPVGEALRVYDDIAKAGGRVIAADMAGIDPRDPTGELALTVMLGVNRMQWRRIAERWDMNRRDAIRAGKAIGGAPFGYRFTDPTPRANGKGVTDSRLVPGPEAVIVRELFERKADGATWLELARFLDAVAPKANGRMWARSTVDGIVSRRTYLGEVKHGTHVRAGAHEAIVTPALWRSAQNPPGHRTPRGAYLLSGLVRCAGCGRRMRATSGGRGKKPPTYGCVTQECPARYAVVTVKGLDAEVVEQFFAHLDAFHLRVVADAELVAVRAAVEERTGVVERLAAVIPTHPAAVKAHQVALEDAERALQEVEDRLHQLTASLAAGGPDVRMLRADWPVMSIDERREIIRAGLDAVLVRRAASRSFPQPPVRDRILVLFRGQGPAGLTRPITPAIQGWSWDDEPGSLVAAP